MLQNEEKQPQHAKGMHISLNIPAPRPSFKNLYMDADTKPGQFYCWSTEFVMSEPFSGTSNRTKCL